MLLLLVSTLLAACRSLVASCYVQAIATQHSVQMLFLQQSGYLKASNIMNHLAAYAAGLSQLPCSVPSAPLQEVLLLLSDPAAGCAMRAQRLRWL